MPLSSPRPKGGVLGQKLERRCLSRQDWRGVKVSMFEALFSSGNDSLKSIHRVLKSGLIRAESTKDPYLPGEEKEHSASISKIGTNRDYPYFPWYFGDQSISHVILSIPQPRPKNPGTNLCYVGGTEWLNRFPNLPKEFANRCSHGRSWNCWITTIHLLMSYQFPFDQEESDFETVL